LIDKESKSGDVGTVIFAEQINTNRIVAIKVLDYRTEE
jgi:uncharacterized protein with FMN-binding domain